mgnify:CR=1 FL=1
MNEFKDIKFGPEEIIEDTENERKNLLLMTEGLSIEDLRNVQAKLGYTVELKEGSNEENNLRDFLEGIINSKDNTATELARIKNAVILAKKETEKEKE